LAERHTNRIFCRLAFGVGAYIFRIASAEQLFIVQQQMAEIMLVSWQPQGTATHHRTADVLLFRL
jgi:hypothetical protein